ncbi:extracellular solute-binding protein [Butyrivibrio sp. MC2013]|uniref:extracellular solute-binding protein n=1 Tax=Butyrivibrio sp. MC2013 TaxID=1280686 RepID=UPI000421DED6|nr:extracellular solute-binding protein [Butyrivibrio sp. MC2013]
MIKKIAAVAAGIVFFLISGNGALASENIYYKDYASMHADEVYEGEEMLIEAADKLVTTDKALSLSVKVEKAGLYVMGVDYRAIGDNILPTSLSMKINGSIPYEEAEHLSFSDIWKSGEKEYDRYGNESIAMPVKSDEWAFTYLRDSYFLQNDPLMVYLGEGLNTVEFTANEGKVEIKDLKLMAPVTIANDPEAVAEGDSYIQIEGESFARRNSPNIRTAAEFNSEVTPYSPYLKMQNVIDETSYRIGGNRIDYEVDVEEEGYYYLAFDYRQSSKSNFTVYRNLYVDGVIPSVSYENIPFKYSGKFTRMQREVPVYLSAGSHILSLEVALEPYGDAIRSINDIVTGVNDLALSVNKITGGNTDKYRDFDLDEYGLDVSGKLTDWADKTSKLYEELAAMDSYGKKNGEIKLLDTASKSLAMLAEKPNDLPKKIDVFSYGDSSVRQYLTTVSENLSYGNLSIDKFYLYKKDAKLPSKPGLLSRASNDIRHFVASFTQGDYAPGYDDSDTLEIWVNRPRQYLEIIQRMADTDFTEKTGIKVNLSIVPDQQKLILANASGKAPDGAIGIASGYVYDLALRNALADMRQFDNFKEVGRRFAPGMLIPGVCDEGIYAIPETFNFYVLFYRSDIFEKLGLEVPDNMDEVRDLLPELGRMGMGFNSHVANLPTKTFAATAPFIFQNGGDIFSGDMGTVRLDSEEVIDGLKYLTENFTVYDMDYEILSFYQSFRDGRTPIGVSDYASYNLLTNAAPELNGCWEIAPYPGLVAEDGTVDRSTSGAAESCLIFESSEQKEAAWKFIDWWMSDEVQTEFSFTLQTTLGNEYMWNSANLNAIAAAPWSEKNKEVILEQIGWTREMPRVPGSYMIERELGNVLVNVVTANENIRTAIDNAQKRINAELARKLEEFQYVDSEGKVIKQLITPDKDLIEEWLK